MTRRAPARRDHGQMDEGMRRILPAVFDGIRKAGMPEGEKKTD
jgi:hypothetical protein